MDDDQLAITPLDRIELLWSAAATVLLLAIAIMAIGKAFRVVFDPRETALQLCRRWALIASATAIAWGVLAVPIRVEPEVPLLVVIAAVDCWLVTWLLVPQALPRARALRRSGPERSS
jgi:hypothetical protein